MDKRMLKRLHFQIKEANNPVGIKRSSFIDLPPSDHVYGLLIKHDEEGAGIGN